MVKKKEAMDLSEPRLISPMLDDFAMGNHISDHHGVRCYPAMRNNSDNRYIVKVISVPASQVQLEALLLTGAYKTEEEALAYFETVANGVVEEVQALNKLATLDGFLPYEEYQIAPMENSVGYEVYLLSPYKKSLARHFRKYPMTHLAAVNLGLDICAALEVCRQAGFLYADLKPDNIFIGEKQEYRIGDLGFIRLDSLKYASLPEKYRSSYTAPECADSLSTLSPSMDIYALGLILYQAYNGGKLPFEGNAPSEALVPPMYADYEMAEIILKACNPDPAERWETPVEMGQALVGYMQRNGANDTPIIPPVAPDAVAGAENGQAAAPSVDDTAPDESTAAAISYSELSEDVTGMLEQADDLISHEAPAGVVAPTPAPLEIPKDEEKESAAEAESEGNVAVQTVVIPNTLSEEELYDEEEYEDPADRKKTVKKVITFLIVLLLVAGLAFGGYYFYQHYYLQPISDLRLEGNEDELRVYLTTDSDQERLVVICTDIYGNARQSAVKDGMAVFTGLNPNTLYKVDVQINGMGKLTGDISESYTTPAQTSIVTYTAVTGSEPGSVILNFTVDGLDADSWTVTGTAEGVTQIEETFTGHMVTIRGLMQGKTYTFRLSSDSDIYLTGNDTLEYTVSNPVYAENVTITACDESAITVVWDTPADAIVNKWTVRCYSPNGYDETLTVEGNTVTFTGVTCSDAHTIEVVAEGMSSGTHCYITAGAVTIKDVKISQVGNNTLRLSWNTGDTPAPGKWLITYSVNGLEELQQIVYTGTNSIDITPIVPNSDYTFTFQVEGGATVFSQPASFHTKEAKEFSGYMIKTKNISTNMCIAPDKANWTHKDVKKDAYTDSFKVGQKAGLVLQLNHIYDTSSDTITAMYVIKDAQGKLVSWNSTSQTWTSMWYKNYCELNIPQLPAEVGDYTLELYFNGCFIHSQSFKLTQ